MNQKIRELNVLAILRGRRDRGELGPQDEADAICTAMAELIDVAKMLDVSLEEARDDGEEFTTVHVDSPLANCVEKALGACSVVPSFEELGYSEAQVAHMLSQMSGKGVGTGEAVGAIAVVPQAPKTHKLDS